MQPIAVDTSGMFSQIAQAGPLFAFMMITIIGMALAIRVLYNRNVQLGDKLQEAFVNSTLAINNSAIAQSAIARQMEIMNAH